jgi:hypothetical protein
MLHTFGTIQCSEVEINYDTQYKDCDGFCNKDKSEIENINITLEIMKLYQGSLSEYINKFNLSEVEVLMKQILLCQMHIYEKIGFLHNDIHLGNILIKIIKESKEPEELQYKIRNSTYIIKTNFKLILSDFDNAIIYNQNILPLEQYDETYTIQYNIIKTINTFKILLNKEDQHKISVVLEKSLNSCHF